VSAEPKPTQDWVVSQDYEGPNRRRRGKLFVRKTRLDDVGVDADIGAESTATLLRRVSLWGNLADAAREQRARFVAMLEALAEKGRRDQRAVWPDIVEAAARYVRAVGASGRIDDPLLNDALQAAQRAHFEGAEAEPTAQVVKRLETAARQSSR
jgi:hypothetical protein